MPLLPLPIHRCYDIELPVVPTARVEEIIAEKLARYRRHSLARDLYDLAWFATKPFDETLVRDLTVLKVWGDVVEEGRGHRPFDPEDILGERKPEDFEPEAIGHLTRPVQVADWIALVRGRFGFLRRLDGDQEKISRCSRGEEWMVGERIRAMAER